MEGLFWDGDDDYLKKTSSMYKSLLFSLSVWHWGSWGKTSRSCKSLGTQAWPESWTPTHGDTFTLLKIMVWAIHVPSIISSPSAHNLFSCSSLPLPPLSWSECRKEPSTSEFLFHTDILKVCGKMVLTLSKLSLWRCRGLPKTKVIWGYLSFPFFISPLKWLCPLLWLRTQLIC